MKISVGQYSDKGRKEINQDFHGAYIPQEPQLSAKGVALVLADGISSSDVSQMASESAVRSFLDDYYSTSDAWSVRHSAQCVLMAANSWLHAQTQRSQYRFDKDRGYVCTLSAMILKSRVAHIFHVGDSRIYRLHDQVLEQLTEDHRVWISAEQSYLSRALGISPQLEIDYLSLALEQEDIFLLASDGVYEYVDAAFIAATITHNSSDLNQAARIVVEEAYQRGSPDNLTLQIVRVEQLPAGSLQEIQARRAELSLPPMLEARMEFDGYQIVRDLRRSHRSHIYLAIDQHTGQQVVLKTPSVDMSGDSAYLDRFLLEEWVARRINSPYVLKPCAQTRQSSFLYVVMEYIDGQTLAQWMLDHPNPDLHTVRGIVTQIAKGLQAFHRMEMLHQDLRPENIMIDTHGTVRIIDFGSTRVAGLVDSVLAVDTDEILGTMQYTAPEYFLGERGSHVSDLFSLGVMTYQMLTGQLPYGANVARTRTRAAQKRLMYISALDERRPVPAWMDDVLKKAVHPNPYRRYQALSEFIYDLQQPSQDFLNKHQVALLEKNPLLFWKLTTVILSMLVLILFAVIILKH
ncbi:bifunctional protein-serine/threonine kinase/phosphatase [Methylobacillus gramineus]|uniref:bifunctional protein-serine/threonine kinase/phosphatase n=1 Tax=Methylobacillus gramineus TaxID=755169 RepID=UPI001D000848|nr:bifunctional protein-serine/threonine kinase/phosphatase [Methylobacillus gramineus]MCB5185026.1 bifunctional protein-serine/threonine kinase/phosphatase [Methylobacillus gramineus]